VSFKCTNTVCVYRFSSGDALPKTAAPDMSLGYSTENTPLEVSHAASLSSLNVDDDDDDEFNTGESSSLQINVQCRLLWTAPASHSGNVPSLCALHHPSIAHTSPASVQY